MAPQQSDLGPDLSQGVPFDSLKQDVPFAGHVDRKAVLMVRQGAQAFAVSAKCTHYGAPLAQGRVINGTIRCPWHHACFALEDGRALRAPGIAPLVRYDVHIAGGVVKARAATGSLPAPKPMTAPKSVSIVGGGAAGFAALATLRQEGYLGPIIVFADEPHLPYDRIKLSKGYLAGSVHDAELALNPKADSFDHAVTIHMGTKVVGLDTAHKHLRLADGSTKPYDAVILAMGAQPKRLDVPGAKAPHVCVLRTLDDVRAIRQKAAACKRAVVIGASFIGLEAACALRQQNIEVSVIASDGAPMANVLGAELSALIVAEHKAQGVHFVMGEKVRQIADDHVLCGDDVKVPGDLVIMAVGVIPDVSWAKAAGLATDEGILVDPSLQTSQQHVYAAGDIAQVRSQKDAQGTRIEHWAVAERLGQRAARSLLGQAPDGRAAPFFWSDHYAIKLRYVGHAAPVEATRVYGDLQARKAAVALYTKGRIAAVVTLGHDPLSLDCEAALEAQDTARLEALLQSA